MVNFSMGAVFSAYATVVFEMCVQKTKNKIEIFIFCSVDFFLLYTSSYTSSSAFIETILILSFTMKLKQLRERVREKSSWFTLSHLKTDKSH